MTMHGRLHQVRKACARAYKGVKTNFEMYGRLVRKGGIIALYDVCPYPPQIGCEVIKFWREIKGEYKHTEIVKDWK